MRVGKAVFMCDGFDVDLCLQRFRKFVANRLGKRMNAVCIGVFNNRDVDGTIRTDHSDFRKK